LKVDERIKKLSERTEIPEEEIRKTFKNLLEIYKDEKIALKKTVAKYIRFIPRGKMKWTQVWIIGIRPAMDLFELYRISVRRRWEMASEEERQKMIEKGIVDESGTVLDYRKTIFNNPNINYGAPLTASHWVRDIWCFASRDDFKTMSLSRLRYEGEIAKEVPEIDLFKSYKVLASRREPKNEQEKMYPFAMYRLGKSSEFIPISIKPAIKDYLGYLSSATYDSLEVGEITWIEATVIEGGIRETDRFFLIDTFMDSEEERLQIFIPKTNQIYFKETESILVFGKVFSNTNDRYAIDCYGYIPLENNEVLL